MARFQPPALDLAAMLAEGNASVDMQASMLASLQLNQSGVKRTKDNDTFAVEINESDLIFLNTLGAGASSIVKKALLIRQKGTGLTKPKYVAVKCISNVDDDLRAQMQKDVKILMDVTKARSALNTPLDGMVAFEGAFMDTNTQEASIVLEYMNGGSLEDVIKEKERIPEDVLGKITFMLLKGLYQLHKQLHIVHRDIKPANILLNLEGVAKISDFGISRPLANTLAMCTSLKGTQNYMAPERIERQSYGFASDIWSLGLVVLECATGKYPFNTSEGPMTTMTDVRFPVPSSVPRRHEFGCDTWATILKSRTPLPPADQYSEELRSFCQSCLQKQPKKQPTALALMSHLFVPLHREHGIGSVAFKRSYSPSDLLECMQILNSPTPLPPADHYSEELRSFCRSCLQKQPEKRPTALALMSHPFVLRHREHEVDTAAFMRSVIDPNTTLTETSFLFAHQYYQLISAALSPDDSLAKEALAALEPLYDARSCFSFQTDSKTKLRARGCKPIVEQLRAQTRTMRGLKVQRLVAEEVDSAAMVGVVKGVLLHVRGVIRGSLAVDRFSEMFALVPWDSTGETRNAFGVANQSFAILRQ